VQHISAGFIQGLARWLDKTTPLRAKVAESGERLRAGTVYFAPDNSHLVTKSGLARLEATPPVDGHRPSVTVLLQSVTESYGSAAVGVLLTGMGHDGARGLLAAHDAGGRTFAQDESSCVVFGMPQAAISSGAADEVLSVKEIAARLVDIVGIHKEVER